MSKLVFVVLAALGCVIAWCEPTKPLGYWSVRGSYVTYAQLGSVPESIDSAIELGNQGQLNKARSEFAETIRESPNDLMAIKGYIDCSVDPSYKGDCYLEIKKLQNGKSNPLASKYLICCSYYTMLHYRKIKLASIGWKLAEKTLNELIGKYPNNCAVVALYGSIGYETTPSVARQFMSQYLKKHDKDYQMKMLLALSYLKPDPTPKNEPDKKPQYLEAIKTMKEIGKDYPAYDIEKYYIGAIYAQMNDKDKAVDYLEKFLKSNKGFEWQKSNARSYLETKNKQVFEK